MRKFDKIKNLKKTNLLIEQRYLKSKGLIKENVDALLEDNYSVDQLVTMALEEIDLSKIIVRNMKHGKFSSRYRSLKCVEFDAELPMTVNLSESIFYTLVFSVNRWCEEDPDGPSSGSSFSLKLKDSSMDSNLLGEDLSDKVSNEVYTKLTELENEISEYVNED